MTSPSGTSTFPPFKFRHRGETVDWRQIEKVDIDLVKRQLDIETLQQHIMEVTFCTLDGEWCQECRSPVDPGLLKVLQLAQLSVEWLLHCQEVLQSQLLLCSHKCHICKKAFYTPEFLHSHMVRRHPEDHESQLQSDRDRKSHIAILETEISALRERNVQLQQNLEIKTAQEKRLESELDRFKAEVIARFERVQAKSARSQEQLLLKLEQQLTKQDESWKAILHQTREHHECEMNKIVNISSNKPCKEVEEPVVVSAPAPEPEPKRVVLDSSSASEPAQSPSMMANALQLNPSTKREIRRGLEQAALKSLEDLGVKPIVNIPSNKPYKEVEEPVVVSAPAPEPEPKRVVLDSSSASEPAQKPSMMANALQLNPSTKREIRRGLEQAALKSLEDLGVKPIVNISSNKPYKEVEEPVVVSAPAPEPEPKRVVLDSSSASEPAQSPSMMANALQLNPSTKREIRRGLEQAALKSLEDLGVKPDQSGVKRKELTFFMAKVHSVEDQAEKEGTGYWRCRGELDRSLEEKMNSRMMTEAPPGTPAPSGQAVQGSETPSVSLVSGPEGRQSKTPKPAPRAKRATPPKTPTPNSKAAPRTCKLMTPGIRMAKWIRQTTRKIRKSLSRPKSWSRSPQTSEMQTPAPAQAAKSAIALRSSVSSLGLVRLRGNKQ